MDELQEMREQMAALKEKLDKQQIITEHNWRQSVNKKRHSWHVAIILSMLAIPFLVWFSYSYHYTTMFEPIAWAIWGALEIYSAIRLMLLLKKQDIMSGNVKDVLLKLYQIKKIERGPLSCFRFICLPIIFIGDGFVRLIQKGVAFGKFHLLYIATLVVVITLSWLYWEFVAKKHPSQWDEYIRQLEEIPELDEEKEEERGNE